MGFLEDLAKLKPYITNQSQIARDTGLTQQTLSRVTKGDMSGLTARNLAKLIDKFGFRLVEKKDFSRSEDEIKNEILRRVFDACAQEVDGSTLKKIMVAVTGSKIAEPNDHIQRAVGN